LHLKGVHPHVACEAPEPLYAVEQIMLGSSDAPLFGGGVGAGELGEAEGPLIEDGAAMSRARLVFWMGARKGAALIALRAR
jgi:hypothetical protein